MEQLVVSTSEVPPDFSSASTPDCNELNGENKDKELENDYHGIKFEEWGFQVERLFEVAHRFYKRNESKAFHPSFDVRNQMNALVLQAKYGNFDGGRAPDIGVLDLIGKNRRYQWSLLKGMSKTEAMSKFICTLDEICPFFKAYAEAVKINSTIKLDKQSINNGTQQYSETENLSRLQNDEQLKAIHTSLCRQTYNQFKGYAEKQHPNDINNQKYLISTLQEQYYQQYISQMNPQVNRTTIGSSSSSSLPSPSMSESATTSLLNIDETQKDSSSPTAINQVQYIPVPQPDSDQINTQRANNIEVTSPYLAQNSLPSQSSEVGSNDHASMTQQVQVRPSSISPESTSSTSYLIAAPSHPDKSKLIIPCNMSGEKSDIVVHSSSSSHETLTQPSVEPYKSIMQVKDIGKFEPFPEPKPIKQPNKPEYKSVSIDIHSVNNNTQVEPAVSLLEMPKLELPPVYQQVDTSQEPPKSSIVSSQLAHDNNLLKGDAQEQNMQTEATQQIETVTSDVVPEQRPPVDTWSCGSSSRSVSPMQQSMNYEPLELATIWTKKGINAFKDSLIDDKHGGAYVVKQGTLLTIQVPTYPDGKYIYWEFATEDYDIGFGLDFVYEAHLAKPLTMSIYEESDDEDEEEELAQECKEYTDVEAVGKLNDFNTSEELDRKREEKVARIANTVTIVPTYRRDSHEEVFVGRHRYPGQGYYLLRFDNTYSVMRSKSLFFRICYFI